MLANLACAPEAACRYWAGRVTVPVVPDRAYSVWTQRCPAMPTISHQRSRKRVPKPDRRRALELLASSPDGCTEGLMVANGFTIELLLELVRTGLATAHAERRIVDGKMTEVARMGITDEGRRLLGSDSVATRRVDSA
jgi:hypothetical protein